MFYKTGHRGARGVYPENTIEGMKLAIRQGVNTLEFDIVVSADNKLVVSHEPYMNPEICLKPDGKELQPEEATLYNLYEMSYEEIVKFDCGIKNHPRFPYQKKERAYKPLLQALITETELFIEKNNYAPIIYDIEIKSEVEEYGISQPLPETFAEMLADVVYSNQLLNRTIIRSFDAKPLQYLKSKHPLISLALIVENNHSSKENVEALGFVPFMYSPEYVLLNEKEMMYLKSINTKVVPWTVNSESEMAKMVELGVDGIITDYPELFNIIEL